MDPPVVITSVSLLLRPIRETDEHEYDAHVHQYPP